MDSQPDTCLAFSVRDCPRALASGVRTALGKDSMEARIPEEVKPAHSSIIEISEAMADFPAVRANLRTCTASPTSTTFLKKKKKKKVMIPTVCRNGCSRRVNPSRRLERFCKHRNGLFKKARELSNSCNAEVAAIVVSPSGTVSDFASSSMNHILKRYQSSQPQMRSSNVLLHAVKSWNCESILFNSRSKNLQELKRCSQHLASSINVVQNCETTITQILEMIHIKKMELLEVEIENMIQQGETLVKENIAIEEKISQLMSTKESKNKAKIETEEFCYQ